jgi:hypothetical protein
MIWIHDSHPGQFSMPETSSFQEFLIWCD